MPQFFEDPADKAAIRHVGRVLYDLSVEASRDLGGESSVTRAELRAVAADLRYTAGYLLRVIRHSAESCSLDAADEKLARFAGKLAGPGTPRRTAPGRRTRHARSLPAARRGCGFMPHCKPSPSRYLEGQATIVA
jgi:hypothetical protein